MGKLALLLLCTACLWLAGCGASSAATEKAGGLMPIKAAYVGSTSVQEPIHLAKTHGFYAQQGLDVSLESPSGPARMAALLSNEIQFAAIGSPEVVEAHAHGGTAIMVATLADYPMFSMYAGKDVKRIGDLAGKQVGVGRKGADTDLAAQVFLHQYGLENKAQIVAVGGSSPAVLAALEKGLVDAGVFAPPATAQAAKDGFGELMNGPKLGIYWTHAGLSVTRSYLRDHPDVVKRFLTAFVQAWRFCADPSNKAAVIEDIAAAAESDKAIAEVSYDYVYPVWAQKAVPTVDPRGVATALALSEAATAKSIKPEQLIDNSIVEELAK